MAKKKAFSEEEQVIETPASVEVNNEVSTDISGVVNCSLLNIRKSPSTTSGKVIGTLNKGDRVTVKKLDDGWCRLVGEEGFVMADYITLE